MSKRFSKKSKNIQVFVVDTLSEQNNIEFSALVDLLPANLQVRAMRYKSKQSAINYCFGRLLLIRAIFDLGFDSDKINQIRYSENDKPFIDGFFFNISHSGNFVSLAFSRDCQLGLDIEHIEQLELKNFKSFFREEEWETINSARDPLEKFYWFWVRKESILKAEDAKMNQVNDIFITSAESGYFKNPENIWQLYEIEIAEKCIGVLACDEENIKVNISPYKLKS